MNHYLCMTGRKIAAYSRSEKGVDQGTLYQLFYSEIGGSGIDSDDIAGGYAGLIPRAESSEQGRLIKLSIRFGIRMPGFAAVTNNLDCGNRLYTAVDRGICGNVQRCR